MCVYFFFPPELETLNAAYKNLISQKRTFDMTPDIYNIDENTGNVILESFTFLKFLIFPVKVQFKLNVLQNARYKTMGIYIYVIVFFVGGW